MLAVRAPREAEPGQIVRREEKAVIARGHDFELVNFACGGETTASFVERKGDCGSGPEYRGTQARAATRFLRRNRGEVGLVTVSLARIWPPVARLQSRAARFRAAPR